MRGADYIAEPSIVTAVHLARAMEKPLLVEGDAGVGKTEIAKVMATLMQTELIRLQCYEGLDVNTALYEWNYQKQLLRLRMGGGEEERDRDAGAGGSGAAAEATGADPAGRGGAPGGARRPRRPPRRRHLRAPLPARAAAAARHHPRNAPRAAHRRDRPGRRRLRGLPARGALRLPGDHPRAGHHTRDPPAARRAHLQSDARDRRRAAAGAASTSTSSTRASPRRSRSSAPRCPGYRTRSPARSRKSCKACARGVS